MKKLKSELEVQKSIIEYLKREGYCFKTVVSNRKGIPDLILCYCGLYIAIEVKAEGKPLSAITPLQKRELLAINKNGGFGFSTNSFEHFKLIFEYFIKI